MNATGSQNNEGVASPGRQKLKQKPGKNKEQKMMNARVSQKLKQTLAENKEQRMMKARGSQNNEGMVNPSHQKLKQTLGENKVKGFGTIDWEVSVTTLHLMCSLAN